MGDLNGVLRSRLWPGPAPGVGVIWSSEPTNALQLPFFLGSSCEGTPHISLISCNQKYFLYLKLCFLMLSLEEVTCKRICNNNVGIWCIKYL